MSKFKVGDLVKGISNRYGITNASMLIGIVIQTDENVISVCSVIHVVGEYDNFNGLNPDHFDFVDKDDPVVSKFLYIYNNYLFDFVNDKIYNLSVRDMFYYIYKHSARDFLECLNKIQYSDVNKVLSSLKAKKIYGYKLVRS